MKITNETCYQALISRDARFDGSFFTAVLTTGIYCRPICPAGPPKLENTRFFTCAAAAEEAGFRPCRRCRPETAPGTPAWLGTSATVARALRLISDGGLDADNLEGFAERLGVGARHLRRLFREELGTSPTAVAQTRRVHFAHRLLNETELSISQVAFSAGFNSIRRFNDVVRETFGRTPTEIRRRIEENGVRRKRSGLSLRIPYREPFDWDAIVRFLRPRAIPGVELVTTEFYRRAFSVDGSSGVMEARPSAHGPYIVLSLNVGDVKGLNKIAARARRLFDCDADPFRINEHLSKNPRLSQLICLRPGLRVPGAFDVFETSVRAVLGQQISVSAATTLAGRLVKTFGEPLGDGASEGTTHLFPTPKILASADLTQIGLPQARASTISGLAGAFLDDPLMLGIETGLEGAVARLKQAPGIGDWTAHYIAMRALGEPDAFPSGDLGLRRAASDGREPLDPKLLEQMSEAWRPWRAYAAMHLWMSL